MTRLTAILISLVLCAAVFLGAWCCDHRAHAEHVPNVAMKHGVAYPAKHLTLLNSDKTVIRSAAIKAACEAIRGCK